MDRICCSLNPQWKCISNLKGTQLVSRRFQYLELVVGYTRYCYSEGFRTVMSLATHPCLWHTLSYPSKHWQTLYLYWTQQLPKQSSHLNTFLPLVILYCLCCWGITLQRIHLSRLRVLSRCFEKSSLFTILCKRPLSGMCLLWCSQKSLLSLSCGTLHTIGIHQSIGAYKVHSRTSRWLLSSRSCCIWRQIASTYHHSLRISDLSLALPHN